MGTVGLMGSGGPLLPRRDSASFCADHRALRSCNGLAHACSCAASDINDNDNCCGCFALTAIRHTRWYFPAALCLIAPLASQAYQAFNIKLSERGLCALSVLLIIALTFTRCRIRPLCGSFHSH